MTEEGNGMNSVTVAVTGMTCRGCVSAVREEIGNIPGVSNVDVDLESGTVRIDSEQPIYQDDIKGAVEEAGYRLAG